jgi:hypothetical protein
VIGAQLSGLAGEPALRRRVACENAVTLVDRTRAHEVAHVAG